MGSRSPKKMLSVETFINMLCDQRIPTRCPDPNKYTCDPPICAPSLQTKCTGTSSCPRKCCVPVSKPPPCPDPAGPVDRQVKKIREACSHRGPTGLRDLGRMFCLYDYVDGGCGPSRQISCQTLKRNLIDFGVQLCDKELEELCAFLNRCNDGNIVVGDLFDIIRPKLSKARADLIEAVYRSIDTDKDGCISLTDVMIAYDHVKHPKFANGEWTRGQVLRSFVDDFRYRGAYCNAVHGDQKCERISKREFLDYYLGYSTFIERDVNFDYMMRQSWKI